MLLEQSQLSTPHDPPMTTSPLAYPSPIPADTTATSQPSSAEIIERLKAHPQPSASQRLADQRHHHALLALQPSSDNRDSIEMSSIFMRACASVSPSPQDSIRGTRPPACRYNSNRLSPLDMDESYEASVVLNLPSSPEFESCASSETDTTLDAGEYGIAQDHDEDEEEEDVTPVASPVRKQRQRRQLPNPHAEQMSPVRLDMVALEGLQASVSPHMLLLGVGAACILPCKQVS